MGEHFDISNQFRNEKYNIVTFSALASSFCLCSWPSIHSLWNSSVSNWPTGVDGLIKIAHAINTIQLPYFPIPFYPVGFPYVNAGSKSEGTGPVPRSLFPAGGVYLRINSLFSLASVALTPANAAADDEPRIFLLELSPTFNRRGCSLRYSLIFLASVIAFLDMFLFMVI